MAVLKELAIKEASRYSTNFSKPVTAMENLLTAEAKFGVEQ